MHINQPPRALLALAFAAAALLSACGGGESAPPRAAIQKVYVAGDSLADVGTFGVKATVQNSANLAAGFPLFPEIVAAHYGIEGQCNFYAFTGTTFTQNPTQGCTNFAVGGGTIVNTTAGDPRSIPLQLATAAQVRGGAWSDSDLILVDGGGNDAAALVGAYLGAASGPGGVAAYQAFLANQIDPTTLGTVLTGANGPEAAALLYMQRTADTYYDAIKIHLLDKGATRVVVLNIPDITLTPRFVAVLAAVQAQRGAAAADQLQGAIRQWITAFNTRLETRIGGDTRVAVVDFYADITDEVTNAAAYGLTNATQPACPRTGTDAQGLPTYSFPACTSAALDAAPPAGASAGWWQQWAFSDGFHPTPFAHRLLAASVSRAIARAGWL